MKVMMLRCGSLPVHIGNESKQERMGCDKVEDILN